MSAAVPLLSRENLAARVSVDLRVFTNTSAWPPSSSVSLTRDHTWSSSGRTVRSVPSVNSMVSPRSTPSFSLTGRQSMAMCSAPSHSAISLLLPTVAERAITCSPGLSMRSFVSVTSSVGPRSGSFIRCTSSAMTRPRERTHSGRWRMSASAFSEVATRISSWSIARSASS